MGRQNCDPTVIHSSIALLQERFRQLEKAKEMRQQRQLLRMFSEAGQRQVTSTKDYESSRQFFHSELILSPAQPLQGSFYVQPNKNKYTDHRIRETPDLVNLWSTNTVMHNKINFDESVVDTSLHL